MEISELRDSRLLYNKKMPAFGYFIIIAVALLLIGVIIWSVYTPKIYVIKSSGNIQSENKNYIMSPYAGEIVSMNISEGDNVEAGDTLFTIKSTERSLSEESFQKQLDMQNEQLRKQRESQNDQLEKQRVIYEKQIEQYNKLVRSVQRDKNLFSPSNPDDNLYYSQFEIYKEQVAQQKVDTFTMKGYGYTDAQIEAEIQKAQSKISEIYYTTIKSAEDQITQAQMQIEAIDSQITAASAELDEVGAVQTDYAVKANASGRVHMLSDYKTGMVVQAASPIGSIGSENDSYIIISAVPASDAARVKLGDKVDIAVAGLTQSIYGTLPGKVIMIDSDITVPQEGGVDTQPYFKVEVAPDIGYLVSKAGNKVNITNGMAVEARIHYDEVSYFNYVLESLGVLTRG
jgi:multidrug efflux pump subunit AcrA (membrane-fusion protein)